MTSIGSPSPFLFGGKKAYSVDRSLRFSRADTTYVERTPSSNGNKRTTKGRTRGTSRKEK